MIWYGLYIGFLVGWGLTRGIIKWVEEDKDGLQ